MGYSVSYYNCLFKSMDPLDSSCICAIFNCGIIGTFEWLHIPIFYKSSRCSFYYIVCNIKFWRMLCLYANKIRHKRPGIGIIFPGKNHAGHDQFFDVIVLSGAVFSLRIKNFLQADRLVPCSDCPAGCTFVFAKAQK